MSDAGEIFSREAMRKVEALADDGLPRALVDQVKVLDLVAPEGYQALATVVQALHDTLVAAGVLGPGAVADTLGRMRSPDEKFNRFLAAFIDQLRAMPFKPVNLRDQLQVIDGKADDAAD